MRSIWRDGLHARRALEIQFEAEADRLPSLVERTRGLLDRTAAGTLAKETTDQVTLSVQREAIHLADRPEWWEDALIRAVLSGLPIDQLVLDPRAGESFTAADLRRAFRRSGQGVRILATRRPSTDVE